MELDIEIQLQELWGDETFENDEWGYLNYFIGPNGTGKTNFAEELENKIDNYEVRSLNAQRLSGLEKEQNSQFYRSQIESGFNLENKEYYRRQAKQTGLSSDAYIELREKPDLRTRIQAILSEFFDKKIKLDIESGYLRPKMQDIEQTGSYDLREDESHGLKELVSLLTLIHDDKNEIIIIEYDYFVVFLG